MKHRDPFAPGAFEVEERTWESRDAARDCVFPIHAWCPREAKTALPLILFSPASGNPGRSASFLCRHLASHGYLVAACDPSEIVAPELKRRSGETAEDRAARIERIIASRVPDLQFLLECVTREPALGARADAQRLGLIGHSFGGWAVLAAVSAMPSVQAVVALAPGGASRPKPGILPVTLDFRWDRNVPTLIVAAREDIFIPIDGVREIFDSVPASKRFEVLERADHMHFMDDVERVHEQVRAEPAEGEYEWMREMRPIAELCAGDEAHRLVCGWSTEHFDSVLAGTS